MKRMYLLLLLAIAMPSALIVKHPDLFKQAINYKREVSFDRLELSIDRASHADIGLTRWSMIGVASMLVFFRLRRKHQATVSSTRLTYNFRSRDSRSLSLTNSAFQSSLPEVHLDGTMLSPVVGAILSPEMETAANA